METQEAPQWTLGDRIKKARKARGLTAHQLAEKARVNDRTIGNYERDDVKRPDLRLVVRIAQATEIPVDWFIEDLDVADPKMVCFAGWAELPWDIAPAAVQTEVGPVRQAGGVVSPGRLGRTGHEHPDQHQQVA